jgi:hypothetical protein
VEDGRTLKWLGHLLYPGLFDGEHLFSIEILNRSQVRFTQHEKFRGILVPVLWRWIGSQVSEAFEEMNRALKNVAESSLLLAEDRNRFSR